MPPRGVAKGSKRARQYEHTKDSVTERGGSEDEAEEIAARTVNARHIKGRSKMTRAELQRALGVRR